MTIKIHPVSTTKKSGHIYLSSEIEDDCKIRNLWFSIPEKWENYIVHETLDAMLIGILYVAMNNKEDIILSSPISEKLYYNLTHYYMPILSHQRTSLEPIKLHIPSLDSSNFRDSSQAIGTGFSCGVDSFCTFIDHFNDTIPENFKITHLTFHNVGSHFANRNLFEARYKLVQEFSKEFNVNLIQIDSNLSDFYPLRFFNPTYSLRNIAPIMLLQKLFSKYYFSTADKYENCFVGLANDISYIDPFALHLLSTEKSEFLPVGSQYSRVEKTKKISEFEPTYRYLNVCGDATGNTANNCSQCDKCCRTLLTLELLGQIDNYKNVFNLDKYKKARDYYILRMNQNKKDTLHKEILDYASEIGVELKPKAVIYIKETLKNLKKNVSTFLK